MKKKFGVNFNESIRFSQILLLARSLRNLQIHMKLIIKIVFAMPQSM